MLYVLPPDEYKALCRSVLERDGWQCRNPHCKWRNNLHIHHIIFRSEQGPDESWNLVAICNACHDAVHAYRLSIGVEPGVPVGPGGGADGKLRFT